jgi:hypothetical protein
VLIAAVSDRYYLGRVSSPVDQRTIVQFVEAAGLG